MLYFPLSAAVFDCPYLQPNSCLYQVRAPQSAHTDEKENRFERYHGIFSLPPGLWSWNSNIRPQLWFQASKVFGSSVYMFLAPAPN